MITQTFLQNAIANSNHHAKEVLEVLPLALGNLYFIGANIKKMRTNIVWFEKCDKPYVIAYNHNSKKIEVRNKSQKGNTLFDFDNNTSIKVVNDLFMTL